MAAWTALRKAGLPALEFWAYFKKYHRLHAKSSPQESNGGSLVHRGKDGAPASNVEDKNPNP